MVTVDTIQTIILAIVSVIMYRNREHMRRNSSVLSSKSSDPQERLVTQMKMLSIFYVVCTFIDWSIFYLGKLAIQGNDLICYQRDIILVNSEVGGLYMFLLTTVAYFYALFMWYVFYQIPKRYGVVSRRSVDDVEMIGKHESFMYREDEENLKTVVREFENEKRFIRQ